MKISFDKSEEIKTQPGANQDFINRKFLEAFQIKRSVSVVPTYIPKNFFEQTVYYKNGATLRRYDYVDGAWVYSTLT
jgi:hypothetical protein